MISISRGWTIVISISKGWTIVISISEGWTIVMDFLKQYGISLFELGKETILINDQQVELLDHFGTSPTPSLLLSLFLSSFLL